MSTLNIHVSPKAKAAAEVRASQARCTLDSYLESLIIADASDDFGAPEHLRVDTQQQLIEMLQEGESSPKSEMNAADWHSLRQHLIAQHTSSKAG